MQSDQSCLTLKEVKRYLGERTEIIAFGSVQDNSLTQTTSNPGQGKVILHEGGHLESQPHCLSLDLDSLALHGLMRGSLECVRCK